MRVAMVVLCIVATTFFLRVLAALVKEGLRWSPAVLTAHSARLNRSTQRGKLIEMKPAAQQSKELAGTSQRLAR
jgi:hypothetical protein